MNIKVYELLSRNSVTNECKVRLLKPITGYKYNEVQDLSEKQFDLKVRVMKDLNTIEFDNMYKKNGKYKNFSINLPENYSTGDEYNLLFELFQGLLIPFGTSMYESYDILVCGTFESDN